MREMHHNEARPVNCDGGRSSMKVQNQVRVWPVGQRTSSWHITDMWDRSVSKPISIDGKMANPPFLERDEEREHTDGLARRPRYMSAFWERGSPDLPACGPRHGYASGPVRPIFINKSFKTLARGQASRGGGRKTSSGAASPRCLARSGDI